MIAPTMLSGTPFGSRTALLDFAGTLEIFMRGIADAAFQLTGESVRVSPIGVPGGAAWLQSIQSMCVSAADTLGIAPPPDLASYDLTSESDFTSWMYAISQEAERLRVAAGIV